MPYDKPDDSYSLVWAKKIRAINLLGGKCEECGNNNIFVLEFHHPRKNKEATFNSLRTLRWSRIKEEIDKCKLLCSNCHVKLSSRSGRISKEKRNLFFDIKKIKCQKCGYTSRFMEALVLHHARGKKKFAIRDYLKNKSLFSVAEFVCEIKKCDVLCRNCHLMRHVDIDKFNRLKKAIYNKVDSYKELRPKMDRVEIKEMHKRGMGVCEISKKMQCSKSAISMILSK